MKDILETTAISAADYFSLYDTYIKNNRESLQQDIELQIIGALVSDISFHNYIFSKIKIDQISSLNRKAFEILSAYDGNIYATTLKLRNAGFNPSDYRINFTPCEFLLENLIKSFYEFSYSIEIRNFLIQALQKAEESVHGLPVIYDLELEIQALKERLPVFNKEKNLADSIPDFIERIQNAAASKQKLYKSDKFPSLNYGTGGIAPGNLVTIMGASGHGKTFLGVELLCDLQKKYDIAAGIISLEMSKEELQDRIIGSELGIRSDVFRDPEKLRNLSESQIKGLARTQHIFANSKIYISEKSMNELQLKEQVKRWKLENDVQVVLIDYIGLIQSTRQYKNSYEDIGYLSGFIKTLSKEISIPIILLAQANRAGVKDPDASNVAGAYKIIQDSDTVFSIAKASEIFHGSEGVKLKGKTIPITPNLHIVDPVKTRHTGNREKFPVIITEHGMRELEPSY